MAHILVVDDELGIRELLSEILNDEGHTVDVAEDAASARIARQESTYDLILLDIWMPDTDGVTLLKEWASQNLLNVPVIMMSGHATIETAVEATRIGAHSFLEKPVTMHKLLKAVQSALIREALRSHTATAHGGKGSSAHTRHLPLKPMAGVVQPVIPPSSQSFELDKPLRDARDEFERAYFTYHLQRENGSMTRVAEKTGLERTHLYRKLKQLGVDINREKRCCTSH